MKKIILFALIAVGLVVSFIAVGLVVSFFTGHLALQDRRAAIDSQKARNERQIQLAQQSITTGRAGSMRKAPKRGRVGSFSLV